MERKSISFIKDIQIEEAADKLFQPKNVGTCQTMAFFLIEFANVVLLRGKHARKEKLQVNNVIR